MNKLREGALKYLNRFFKCLITVLNLKDIPSFNSELEKLDYIEKIFIERIETRQKLLKLLSLISELTTLRIRAANNIRENLILVRGILEGEVKEEHLNMLAQHSLPHLNYAAEIL
ncbi:MAG: hypothetical protein ACTSYQ_05260 [Candidatus Odinarchaeia archaeon]